MAGGSGGWCWWRRPPPSAAASQSAPFVVWTARATRRLCQAAPRRTRSRVAITACRRACTSMGISSLLLKSKLGCNRSRYTLESEAACLQVPTPADHRVFPRRGPGKRVPKGAKMEPKSRKIGTQNVQKNEVSQKSAKCGLDLLFTIYSHYWHPAKTSLFHTSKQQK